MKPTINQSHVVKTRRRALFLSLCSVLSICFSMPLSATWWDTIRSTVSQKAESLKWRSPYFRSRLQEVHEIHQNGLTVKKHETERLHEECNKAEDEMIKDAAQYIKKMEEMVQSGIFPEKKDTTLSLA